MIPLRLWRNAKGAMVEREGLEPMKENGRQANEPDRPDSIRPEGGQRNQGQFLSERKGLAAKVEYDTCTEALP